MYGVRMDEATELKLLEEMLLVGKDDGIHLDDVEVSTIDYESALQVVAAAFHSESRSFPLIANRGAPSSFKGRAAVDWMVDHFLLKKRDEAVFIGQTLMDRQIVKLRPKKTLLDDLISANKDSKAKDSSRGEAEVEIGVFADADDKHYMFQKAPLMMENYIRKHLPISVAQLLKDYPPPPRAGATSPPPASSSSSSASSSPFLSPRARAATSFSLAAMTRSSSSRSFTELPIPSSSSPSPSSSSSSSSSSFPATTSSPSTASTSKPFIRRHGRSASVTLTGSSLTVPLKHNNNNNGDSASPLASPTASPRKISKARRASLVLKEKFLIFRENRLDKSDGGGGLDDKEEWERGGYGDGSHTHRNQHNTNSNNDSNSNSINHNNSSSDSDSDESSSSDDSSDTNEAALPAAAAAKSSNHGSGMLSIPSARRRASMLFSPLRLGKDSSSSSLAVSEEANRDVVVKKVVVARRLLDENGEWSSAADGERESTSTSTSSNSSSPRTSSSSTTTSASTSSRPGSPIMPPPSPRTQLTLDKLREAAGAKKAGVQGRLRGKSSADLVKTSNPLYGTAALDLEEMVREREERNREKHERREARRVRREERRRRRAERAEAAAAAGVVVKEAAHVDEGRSRGGSSEGDHPSSSPSTSTSASPARSPRPRSPNRGRTSADRDSITFAATVDNDDDDRAAAGSAGGGGGGGKQRRSSDGMILTLQGQAKKKANSVDKKDTRLDQEAGTDSPIKPARQSRLRRASSLRVSSGNLLLGRSSSDKKEKEKEKEKEKDKIKKMTVVDSGGGGGGGSSVNKKEDDKRHRRKGGSFIKPRASRDELDTVVGGGGGGKQSPEQHPRSAVVRELAADVDSMAADKSKRKRNLTPHSVALPLAQRMSVGVRSRSATLDVVDSSDEGEGGAAPPASNTSPGVAKKAATSTMTTTGGD